MTSKKVQAVDAINDRILAFLKKHPAAVTGGVGVGIGASALKGPVNRTENNIMREYLRAPGGKYSSCAVMEKFAERKMLLAARTSYEKVAEASFNSSFEGGLGGGAGKGIMTEGLAALRRFIGQTAQAISERFIDDPKREKIIGEVVKDDSVVSTAEREAPGQAAQAYQTMRRFAPTLSTDPNVVRSFLRNSALTGGPMDFQTVKGLADAETSIQRAKNEGAWLRGGF